MSNSIVDRLNKLTDEGNTGPDMSMEDAAVDLIKAGTTYNASARIIRGQTSMLDALFRAVA